MKIHHRPSHWVAVALVLVALMLALNEAHGQGAGAASVFEGRPAMAGTQAGLGAQAGPPQGGVGVQGPEAAQRNLNLRRPSGLGQLPPVGGKADEEGLAARAEGGAPANGTDTATPCEPRRNAPADGK
jgi:hypothetical protein